jgi:hypothetical protein
MVMRSRAVIVLLSGSAIGGCATEVAMEPEPAPEAGDVAFASRPMTWDEDSCQVTIGAPWSNRFVPRGGGGLRFVELDVKVGAPDGPPEGPLDAVIGLSDGKASQFTQLGPIVRFNPQGVVDARNGGSYMAATVMPYASQRTYHVTIAANLTTRRYDATVFDWWGNDTATIADDYAFRTEQAGMTAFDVVASKLDSESEISICGIAVHPPICQLVRAGSGWHARTYPTRTGPFQAEVDLFQFGEETPHDMVVGLAGKNPTAFRDLAAILRLNPQGFFDARDGGTYRAVNQLAYTDHDTLYRAIFVVDPAARRYSVWVKPGTASPVLIGEDFAFRTEQAALGAFTHLGLFMEPVGATEVQVCDLTISY